MTLPTDANERKQIPIYSGFISYFPDAMAAVAQHSYNNNEVHNPGEPLHWSREKSTDQLDALARHLTELSLATNLQEEIEYLKAIVWRGAAQLQLKCEERDKVIPVIETNRAIDWEGVALKGATDDELRRR